MCVFFVVQNLDPNLAPGPKFGSISFPFFFLLFYQCRTRAPMSVPGTENQKDARRKTMQNPASRIPNGAIWCKLWPKNILGHFAERVAPGNPREPEATAHA